MRVLSAIPFTIHLFIYFHRTSGTRALEPSVKSGRKEEGKVGVSEWRALRWLNEAKGERVSEWESPTIFIIIIFLFWLWEIHWGERRSHKIHSRSSQGAETNREWVLHNGEREGGSKGVTQACSNKSSHKPVAAGPTRGCVDIGGVSCRVSLDGCVSTSKHELFIFSFFPLIVWSVYSCDFKDSFCSHVFYFYSVIYSFKLIWCA